MLFQPVTHALNAWRRLLLTPPLLERSPAPTATQPPSGWEADAPLDIDLTRLELSASMDPRQLDGLGREEEGPSSAMPAFEETVPGLKADAAGWRTQPFVRYNA
jgi:hypothetical protein